MWSMIPVLSRTHCVYLYVRDTHLSMNRLNASCLGVALKYSREIIINGCCVHQSFIILFSLLCIFKNFQKPKKNNKKTQNLKKTSQTANALGVSAAGLSAAFGIQATGGEEEPVPTEKGESAGGCKRGRRHLTVFHVADTKYNTRAVVRLQLSTCLWTPSPISSPSPSLVQLIKGLPYVLCTQLYRHKVTRFEREKECVIMKAKFKFWIPKLTFYPIQCHGNKDFNPENVSEGHMIDF